MASPRPQSSPASAPSSWPRSVPDFPPDRVLAAYHDGVRALGHLAAKTVAWSVPTPCAGWTLLELAGHALCIARYYHRLLNAALDGDPLQDLPGGRAQAEANAADLVALAPMPGPQRVVAFDAVAGRYGERLADVDWTLTLGSWAGLGPLTIGQHALLAVAEWHLHAWDVARSFGWDYRPDDPAAAAAAGRWLVSDAGGHPEEPRSQSGDPWDATLTWAGRHP